MSARALARRFAEASPASRAFVGAVVLLLVAGTWFRCSGALTTPLWDDEARQVVALGRELRLAELAAWPLNLRPILYLLVGKVSILAYDVEWVLRLTSLLPSIAALFVTLVLARLLFASRVAVLFTLFCVALNPWLIDFAKEYKPYALEHFLVTLQVTLLFRWLQQRRRASLGGLLILAALSPLAGFACAFVEPVLLAIVVVDAWRAGERRALALTVGAGVATAALFAAQYLLFSRYATKVSFRYWNENFYDTGFGLRTFAAQLFDLGGRFAGGPLSFPGLQGLAGLLAAMNVVLLGSGLAALVARRRWALLAVIVGPLVLPLLASFAGRWPYGMVRVNLYMIALVVLAWGAAIDFAVASRPLRWTGLATVGLLAVLQLPLDPGPLLAKQLPAAHMRPPLRATNMPALLGKLFTAEADELAAGASVCVHVSTEALALFTYYTRQYDGRSLARTRRLRTGRLLSPNTRVTMLEMSAALRGDLQPCWLLRTYKYDEQLAAHRVLKEEGFHALEELEAAGLFATKIERVQPAIVAASDGSITLRGADAVLHGDGLWFYGRARIGGLQGTDPRWASEAIGNWTAADATVTWSFEVARAAELDVQLRQAAGPESGRSEYDLVIDGQRLHGAVQPTGSWHDFTTVTLGPVTLAPGRHTAAVQVTARRGAYIMNLRAITLTPRPSARAPD